MSWLIHVAVALLPSRLRSRYREQWLGDFTRADELGIRRSSIAVGSLVFAARVDRPFAAATRTITPERVDRRSRVAAALALSSAVLALSQYAGLFASGLSAQDPAGFVVFFATAVLTIYSLLAPIVALVLVSITSQLRSRVRVAVWLLALASLAWVAQSSVDTSFGRTEGFTFLTLGSGAYIVAGVLVVFSVRLLAVQQSPMKPARTRDVVLAGLVTCVFVALGLGWAMITWITRTPLVFGDTARDPGGLLYAEWLTLKVGFEHGVDVTFVVWGMVGFAMVVVLAITARILRTSRSTVLTMTLAVLCVIAIASASLVAFLRVAMPDGYSGAPVALLVLVARAVLVGVILRSVGGIRFARRAAVQEQQEAEPA